MDWTLILEYLKVLLSAPPVIGAVVLLFLWWFRKNIGALIDRTKQLDWPGGGVKFGSQQNREREQVTAADAPPLAAGAQRFQLPNTIQVTHEQAQQIGQLVQSERANAVLWEYKYLNYFLVRGTQAVLDWLATQQPIALRMFDNIFQNIIADANERAAILTALQNHHLIDTTGDLIQVTPKGREYLQWRGPLPPLPPPGQTTP